MERRSKNLGALYSSKISFNETVLSLVCLLISLLPFHLSTCFASIDDTKESLNSVKITSCYLSETTAHTLISRFFKRLCFPIKYWLASILITDQPWRYSANVLEKRWGSLQPTST